ncbi:MAG TPA: hypothetical protein VLF94_01580 [Chlamydiales bacterium]|nr:hypothetical protein [Chlamydiales bacterium]
MASKTRFDDLNKFISTETDSDQENILFDSHDVKLATYNAARLALEALAVYYPATSLVSIPLTFAMVWQQMYALGAIPSSYSKLALANALLHIGSFIHPTVGKIFSVSGFLGVALNAVPKLFASLKNVTHKPWEALTGTALHVFNLASQGVFAKREIDYHTEKEQAALHCAFKSRAGFAKLDPKERMASPDLDPTCVGDSKIMLGIVGDPKCSEIEKLFRDLSKITHPDKGGSDALQSRLTAARDTLDRLYQCKA